MIVPMQCRILFPSIIQIDREIWPNLVRTHSRDPYGTTPRQCRRVRRLIAFSPRRSERASRHIQSHEAHSADSVSSRAPRDSGQDRRQMPRLRWDDRRRLAGRPRAGPQQRRRPHRRQLFGSARTLQRLPLGLLVRRVPAYPEARRMDSHAGSNASRPSGALLPQLISPTILLELGAADHRNGNGVASKLRKR
jgi:hypothetical protein